MKTMKLTAICVLGLTLVASGQFSLTTTYAGGNGQTGNMFDITPQVPVLITDFDVNTASTGTVEVYMVTGGGTYFGNESNPAAWTMVASVPVAGAGAGVGTPLNANLAIPLNPGMTYGFYITLTAGTLTYTNGTGTTAGAVFASDGNIDIHEGIGIAYSFQGPGFIPRVWNGTVHYNIVSTNAVDILMSSVDSPISSPAGACTPLTANETVTVSFINLGSVTIPGGTMIPVSYTLNDPTGGSTSVTENYTVPMAGLAQFTSASHTFAAAADLSTPGIYTIDANISLVGDMDPSNDSLFGYSVTSAGGAGTTINSFPYVQNFDLASGTTPPALWTNDTGDAGGTAFAGDWNFLSTPSSTLTGPATDHTSGAGVFALADDSGQFSDVNLITPCIDATALPNLSVEFWYHSWDANTAAGASTVLHVDIIGWPGGIVVPDVIPPLMPTGNAWSIVRADISGFAGSIFQLRFRADTSNGGANQFNNDVAIDDFRLFQVAPVDVAVDSIDAPTSSPAASCSPLTASEIVTITVSNQGSLPLAAGDMIPVSYSYDDGVNPPLTVNETLVLGAALAQFQSTAYTFATPADLSIPAIYNFSATASLPGDLIAGNDTATTQVTSAGGAGTSVIVLPGSPFTENFDALTSFSPNVPPNWTNDPNDATGTNSDWMALSGGTGSLNTGPTGDHTTGAGIYMYVEDSVPGNYPAVNLITPCIDVSALATVNLEFWVHSNDGTTGATNQNFLHIDVISWPTGAVTQDVVPPIGHLGDFWALQVANLTGFGSVIQVRFRGDSTNGGLNTFTHDICIDDVKVFEPIVAGGQAPQAGLAVFDINGALEPNGAPVSSGNPGPYSTTVSAGTVMTFSVSGEPLQSIILLSGPLNVGHTSFTGIGQLDVGTAASPLPMVIILADGLGNTGFVPEIWHTDGAGDFQFSMTQNLPAGFTVPLQCAVFNTQPQVVSLSNAVVLNT